MKAATGRGVAGMIAVALNACGPADVGSEPVDQAELGAGIELPPLPLDGRCRRIATNILSNVPRRYLDAHTTGDRGVVTRERQFNDTQLWCFTRMADGRYRIQHRNFDGQFLDAWTTRAPYEAVLREYKDSDDTQLWELLPTGAYPYDWYRFRQGETGKVLEASMSVGSDYPVVARPVSPSFWQEWLVMVN
jgi:hypothetical protein